MAFTQTHFSQTITNPILNSILRLEFQVHSDILHNM